MPPQLKDALQNKYFQKYTFENTIKGVHFSVK